MLGSHANVYNTCLRILVSRGWLVNLDGEADHTDIIISDSLSWTASKNGYELSADNPIELLGLSAIYDFKQPVGEPVP